MMDDTIVYGFDAERIDAGLANGTLRSVVFGLG